MIRPSLVVFAVLGVQYPANPVFAQGAPEDFAFGIELQPGPDAVQTLLLPIGVYQETTRDDLRDVQLFSAGGDAIPFAIRSIAPERQALQRSELKIFPIRSATERSVGEINLQIERREDGRLVSITDVDDRPEPEATTRAYIIDTSGATDSSTEPHALIFDWSDDAPVFVSTVRIETSRDLTSWRPLLNQATLASLEHDGQRLKQNVLALGSLPDSYLRVTWNGTEPAPLRAVELETRPSAKRAAKKTLDVTAQTIAAVDSGYEYDLGGPVPVDGLRLTGLTFNTVSKIRVLSRSDPDSSWRLRSSGMVFSLNSDGSIVESPALPISRQRDRYWRVEEVGTSGGLGSAAPRLQVEWTPEQLVFVKRDDQPVTLAFGSRRVETTRLDPQELLAALPSELTGSLTPSSVGAGSRFELGGPDTLRAPPKAAWKTYVLWGALIAAAAFVIALSVSLLTRMGREA